MENLYCFVDETGQDVQSRLFIVSIIVLGEKDGLLRYCETRERDSGKGKAKWSKVKPETRLKHLSPILSDQRFRHALRYSIFQKPTDYDSAKIEAIARALHFQAPEDYSAFIYVDALAERKRWEYTVRLRRLGVSVQKVRGGKDENNALIRLAHDIAAFVRDIQEGEGGELKTLFDKAKQNSFLVQL